MIKGFKKAFTLVEVVIILAVLSLGVFAALSLAIRSSSVHNVQRDFLSVSFLSSEGLELMTNIRDTNIILENNYDNWDGLGSAGIGEKNYRVDYFSLSAEEITEIDEAVLKQDENGFYRYNIIFPDSPFSRVITSNAESTASTSISSTVYWFSRGESYEYKIEKILYDLSF
jgi:hypothetical protein